jgi:hypothetical protein
MLEDALKSVKEAEKKAGILIQEADAKAASIVEEAKAKAKAMKEETASKIRSGSQVRRRAVIFIIRIDQFFNSDLNDCLGTLIAWEQCHIEFGPVQTSAPIIQYGVQFAVCYICIFTIVDVSVPVPWILIIIASLWKSIIPHGENFILFTDNACTDLRIGVLGTHGRQLGDPHKVLVP